jgi:hypothetical protein
MQWIKAHKAKTAALVGAGVALTAIATFMYDMAKINKELKKRDEEWQKRRDEQQQKDESFLQAIRKADCERVLFWLDQGANINAKTDNNKPALYVALENQPDNGNTDILKLLLTYISSQNRSVNVNFLSEFPDDHSPDQTLHNGYYSIFDFHHSLNDVDNFKILLAYKSADGKTLTFDQIIPTHFVPRLVCQGALMRASYWYNLDYLKLMLYFLILECLEEDKINFKNKVLEMLNAIQYRREYMPWIVLAQQAIEDNNPKIFFNELDKKEQREFAEIEHARTSFETFLQYIAMQEEDEAKKFELMRRSLKLAKSQSLFSYVRGREMGQPRFKSLNQKA